MEHIWSPQIPDEIYDPTPTPKAFIFNTPPAITSPKNVSGHTPWI